MAAKAPKYVYAFGGGTADGRAEMKNLLGGKGANLAEMSRLGIPVPPGFTITTEVCADFMKHKGAYPAALKAQVDKALAKVEKQMGRPFGDPANPLLFSVRSGARSSMPGMMETVLNIGLTSRTLPGLIAQFGDERFAYDAYRRLIMMYSDVVMEKAAGIEVERDQGIRMQLERILEEKKRARGVQLDTQLTAGDLKDLCERFKKRIQEVLNKEFPDDPQEQLWGGIAAVFHSWNGKRAVSYRKIEGIPGEWGTAVNVQAMVFGNMGEESATGVAFTRDPATGQRRFYGEFLINAQGEDVVAGIRTPQSINEIGKSDQTRHLSSLESAMPKLYKQLVGIYKKLEKHYRDMQDIEFTIERGTLWMLQTRVGKRTGTAAIRMAVEMASEGLISKPEALMRVKPEQLDELLHPMLDPAAEKAAVKLATGLPAGPGGATGKIAFTADEAESRAKTGEPVVLVRPETSPEDVHGMHAAAAILTSKGGMTSHAALVARGWGKCCIVGCGALDIDTANRRLTVNSRTLGPDDWISLNGARGVVYEGKLAMLEADPEKNEDYRKLMKWADQTRQLLVRANADTPEDAAQAVAFGAQGIGLTRTEHMFFAPDRIKAMREMIVAETEEARRKAVMKLLPYQKNDFVGILKAMGGRPVTIRLLDPPLHEFLPKEERLVEELAQELGVRPAALRARMEQLHELNPMLGHRGCRLGVSYPEITEMQVRAIFEATAELTRQGERVMPEVMVPLVGTLQELDNQVEIIHRVAQEVVQENALRRLPYTVGTMIEVPRAALTAGQIAQTAEFFSFGTNDLTQMTFGFSRDDIGGFLPYYLEQKILPDDPFQTIDRIGVGRLVELAVQEGRQTRPDLKIGICGEHGGDPDSVMFCHRAGLNYVSCSPFRVPIARLAAAQAAILWPRKAGKKPGKKAARKAEKKAAKKTAKKKAVKR